MSHSLLVFGLVQRGPELCAVAVVVNGYGYSSAGFPLALEIFLRNYFMHLANLLVKWSLDGHVKLIDAVNSFSLHIIILLETFQAADSIGQVDTVAVMIEEAGGVDKIEQLQQHENEDVYNAAYNIIDKYFSAEVSTCLQFPKNNDPLVIT